MEEYIERPVDEQQVCERREREEGRVYGATWRDQGGWGGGGEGAPDESRRIHMTFSGSIHVGTRGSSW